MNKETMRKLYKLRPKPLAPEKLSNIEAKQWEIDFKRYEKDLSRWEDERYIYDSHLITDVM